MLDILNSPAALNTLGPRTMFSMVVKFATEAKEKGDISERQYMEIMQPFFGKGGETLTRKIDEEREYLDEYQTGGRVPYKDAKLVDPGYFMHNKNRYEYNPNDPKNMRDFQEALEKLKNMYEKEGIIERKAFSETDKIPPENYLLEAIQNPEIYFPTENTPEELKEIEKILRLKQEVKDGGRIGFGLGGFEKARRLFLKTMGAGAVGVGAAKSGLFGLLKGSKSAVVKDLTSIPIEKVGAGYMPDWFKPLVNKVIKEGDDVTKKFATADREIVHTKKLDDFEEVTVHQNLDEGTIEVSYKTPDSMAEAG